jgi:DNA polymerase I-like protein with 3'-5' exonuclease and polymerase domains
MSVCTDERPGARQSGQRYHSLKNNAREWLGFGWWEEEVKPFYKGKMNLLPPEKVEAYNARDACGTKRLVPIFTPKMVADGTDRLYRDLLIPATDTFIDMQIRGINVDQRRLGELAYDDWFPRYVTMYRDLQLEAREIGWPTDDININSHPQMSRLFYEILGVEVTKKTKGGKPSLDKETLDRMDHPFAAKIRAYRTLDTMVDYIFQVFIHLKHDGLLHPSAFVSTTRTGRTSYRDPAMQTIPKGYMVGEDYARLREIIVPHDPQTH